LEIRGLENANEAVSVDFSNLSLEKGLETLLAGTDYALILAADFEKSKPGLLLIFGRHAKASQQGPLGKDTASGTNAGKQEPAAAESLEVAARQIEEDPTVSEQQKVTARLQLSAVQRDSVALKKALADPDPLIQGNALEALVQMDDREALDALIAVIKDELNPGRTQALEFLDQARWVDEGTVLSVLGDALKDEDANIRGLAIQALANRDNAQAMDLLERVWSDSDPTVRLMVVQSVAQKKAGFPLLEKAAGDQDEGVRSSAEEALKYLDSSRE
jgi:HEAT repeat protein